MATMMRRFIQRVRALSGSQAQANMSACNQPAENTRANLPDLHVQPQSVESVRSFNTARVERIYDPEAVSNLSARESRRAVVTRPMQF